LYLGAANGGGTALYFSTKQYAFCSIGNGLNATNQSNFYTAVQTFNQTLSRQVGAQIVSDADAQAYINRVYTAGGTLTNTEATAVNQLTIDMKASNVWTSMKAVYPMIGSSAAACAQNLKSSSFTGTFTSGWTFASTGVTPNGTSAYFNTTLIPSTSLSVNSTHQSIYLNTNNVATSADPVDMGSFSSVAQAITLNQSSLAGLIFGTRNLGNFISTTQATRQGFGITSKTSATLTTLYKNGTSVVSGNSGGTLPSFNVYIGNLNFMGLPYPQGYTNNKIAFSSIGDGLDNTQASDFYTNVQTFNTTLSRQV
jgi:hypothetical protein